MKSETFLRQLECYFKEYLKLKSFRNFHLLLTSIIEDIGEERLEKDILSQNIIKNERHAFINHQEFIKLWTKMILGRDLMDEEYHLMFLFLEQKALSSLAKKDKKNLLQAIDIMAEHNPEYVLELAEKNGWIEPTDEKERTKMRRGKS